MSAASLSASATILGREVYAHSTRALVVLEKGRRNVSSELGESSSAGEWVLACDDLTMLVPGNLTHPPDDLTTRRLDGLTHRQAVSRALMNCVPVSG